MTREISDTEPEVSKEGTGMPRRVGVSATARDVKSSAFMSEG